MKYPVEIIHCSHMQDSAQVMNVNVKLTISTTGIAIVVIGSNAVGA